MAAGVHTVHLVAKTHLDLGFTALAAEVEQRYLTDLFPRAIATAAELRERGGPERLTWTTGSWILHRALGDPRVVEAVEAGDLAWHALPLTFHTELMDAPLVRTALGISKELDERFGRTTTAAKMTDVPGHTRGLVPLLAEAGVTFLHLGVNPAWPVPDVPSAFRWRSPEGSEVVVAYQAGGYGGDVVVDGCGDALVFLHAGDNAGPPTAEDVVAVHAELRARYHGAEVRASTLDAFGDALIASGATDRLPVVTSEIGDPWLFGTGSDPQKVARFRELLRGPRSEAGDRRLLLVAEHTWGLDQKEALPDAEHWSAEQLAALRQTRAAQRFEASWAEQRAYVDLPAVLTSPPERPDAPELEPGVAVRAGEWELAANDAGELVHAVHVPSGRRIADPDHPLGVLLHQTFGADDYERFYAQLQPTPEDDWWARWDNTKPGLEHVDLDAPGPETWSTWRRWTTDGPRLALHLGWDDKPASRLPEATWCSFVPIVGDPTRWTFDKLGQDVSPLDVVARGGRSLHAVGERGARNGDLALRTPDAPLIAPGPPHLLDADPPLPDLAGGLHVLLHDNCWGTNFPMWNEGPAAFRFELELS